jgi:hypothetical protein
VKKESQFDANALLGRLLKWISKIKKRTNMIKKKQIIL